MSTTLTAVVLVGILALVLLLRRDGKVRMPAGASAGSADSVEAALASGRKIDAIKLYREHHGVGLREAKDAVENLQRSLPTQTG